jgi:DNA-binding CsgD family transcriptional regulator
MKVNPNVIHRNVAGEDMLVPTGENALEHNGLFVLTPTGAEMWDYLAEGKSLDELVAIMSEDYDVDEDVIRNDAENLIQKLRALDLIID